MNSLKEKYIKEVIPKMREKFGYKNDLAVPKLVKAVLNARISASKNDKNYLDLVSNTLSRISGQKALFTKARQSISSFKIREGDVVGVKTTIRQERMYSFLMKLINLALPNVRDFHGVDIKNIDDSGNLTIGFCEHIVFPEISTDEVENLHGLEVTVVTTAKTRHEGQELLRLLGFPFMKK